MQHPDSVMAGDMRNKILLLFDVDGTLTPPRQGIGDDMDQYLQSLREKMTVGLVGGSDLTKVAQQMLPVAFKSREHDAIQTCVQRFDYVFAENGLVAYKNGELITKQSLINHLGDEKLQRFINFCLGYMSKLVLPVKRGNFIEFRNGLINICPVGRSCNQTEREQFNAFDQDHKIRQSFIDELEKNFGPNSSDPLGLEFVIGGQISFDAFPKGWDKTFCLKLVDNSFKEIHFFGDKTDPGGNDHAIFSHPRTIGHTVNSPQDTLSQLKALKF